MESKVDIYKKRIGQLSWISAEKSVLKGFTLLGHEDFTRCSNTCDSTNDSNLKRHMLIHSGEKLFRCEQCNFSGRDAGYFKRHLLTHSGERPFSCNQCKYSCTDIRNLKRRIQTHSGGKPFSCSQCNYLSANDGNLKRHTLIH